MELLIKEVGFMPKAKAGNVDDEFSKDSQTESDDSTYSTVPTLVSRSSCSSDESSRTFISEDSIYESDDATIIPPLVFPDASSDSKDCTVDQGKSFKMYTCLKHKNSSQHADCTEGYHQLYANKPIDTIATEYIYHTEAKHVSFKDPVDHNDSYTDLSTYLIDFSASFHFTPHLTDLSNPQQCSSNVVIADGLSAGCCMSWD